MRISHTFLLLLCLTIGLGDVSGQERRRRPERKPGEIITRPDMQGGFPVDRLETGQPAPEFVLPRLSPDGKQAGEVSLKSLHAERPAVLIFGSITCPPFKGQLSGIDEVYERFRAKAEFLFVYVREAHPDSVLSVLDESQKKQLRKIPQPKTLEERTGNAQICRRSLSLKLPMAIDRPDNAVQLAYAGWPNRMVVVGTDGNILYKSVPGPNSTSAERLSQWLAANLP